jgi:hypothetical protein
MKTVKMEVFRLFNSLPSSRFSTLNYLQLGPFVGVVFRGGLFQSTAWYYCALLDYYVATSDKLQPAFQDNHLCHPQWSFWTLVVVPYRRFEKKYRAHFQGNF